MTHFRKPNYSASQRSLSRHRLWPALIAVGMLAGGVLIILQLDKPAEVRQETRESVEPSSLARLLSLRMDQLAGLGIARLNLLCAEGFALEN